MEDSSFTPRMFFPETETEFVVALRQWFATVSESTIQNAEISVIKTFDTGVVVNRSGGSMINNGLYKQEIFTIQIWADDFDVCRLLAEATEYYSNRIQSGAIKRVWVEMPQRRVPYEDTTVYLRMLTVNVLTVGSSQPSFTL